MIFSWQFCEIFQLLLYKTQGKGCFWLWPCAILCKSFSLFSGKKENQADKKYLEKDRRTASTLVFIDDLAALKDDSEFVHSISEIYSFEL